MVLRHCTFEEPVLQNLNMSDNGSLAQDRKDIIYISSENSSKNNYEFYRIKLELQ